MIKANFHRNSALYKARGSAPSANLVQIRSPENLVSKALLNMTVLTREMQHGFPRFTFAA